MYIIDSSSSDSDEEKTPPTDSIAPPPLKDIPHILPTSPTRQFTDNPFSQIDTITSKGDTKKNTSNTSNGKTVRDDSTNNSMHKMEFSMAKLPPLHPNKPSITDDAIMTHKNTLMSPIKTTTITMKTTPNNTDIEMVTSNNNKTTTKVLNSNTRMTPVPFISHTNNDISKAKTNSNEDTTITAPISFSNNTIVTPASLPNNNTPVSISNSSNNTKMAHPVMMTNVSSSSSSSSSSPAAHHMVFQEVQRKKKSKKRTRVRSPLTPTSSPIKQVLNTKVFLPSTSEEEDSLVEDKFDPSMSNKPILTCILVKNFCSWHLSKSTSQ